MANKEYDRLIEKIKKAKADCKRLHKPWQRACERLRALERQRSDLARKLRSELKLKMLEKVDVQA